MKQRETDVRGVRAILGEMGFKNVGIYSGRGGYVNIYLRGTNTDRANASMCLKDAGFKKIIIS